MEGYLVYCMFVFCMVTDFSAAEKDSAVKLRTLVRLLSIQVLSYFGELWLAWSRDTDITSGISYVQIARGKNSRRGSLGSRNLGAPYGGISVLLTELFVCSLSQRLGYIVYCVFVCLYCYGFLSGVIK